MIKNALLSVVLGFTIGIGACFAVVTYYNLAPSRIGSKLDQDVIFLKNGRFLRGQIVDKRADEILVEIDNGSITFKKSEISYIHENVLMQYLRKVS